MHNSASVFDCFGIQLLAGSSSPIKCVCVLMCVRERKRKRKRKRERESGGGDDSWSVEDADAWMQVPDTPTMTTSLWNPPSSSSNSCNSTTDHHRYNNMVRLFKWRFLTPSAQPMTLICDF